MERIMPMLEMPQSPDPYKIFNQKGSFFIIPIISRGNSRKCSMKRKNWALTIVSAQFRSEAPFIITKQHFGSESRNCRTTC